MINDGFLSAVANHLLVWFETHSNQMLSSENESSLLTVKCLGNRLLQLVIKASDNDTEMI